MASEGRGGNTSDPLGFLLIKSMVYSWGLTFHGTADKLSFLNGGNRTLRT